MSDQAKTVGHEPQIELLNASIARGPVASEEDATLRQISWSVCAGDFWVVGAPPGAGKTGLLTTAAGLQRPVAGELVLFGYPTRGATEHDLRQHRRRIGLLLEGGGRVFDELTVAENVSLPICYHTNCRADEAQEMVRPFLAATGLERAASRLPVSLHRNLRTRVALARALALKPEVILIDNPLGGLDPRQSRWWLEFLCSLSKGHELLEGKPVSIAVTTEDLRPWLEFGSRFAVVKQKHWLELGPKEAVENTKDEFVREMLGLYEA